MDDEAELSVDLAELELDEMLVIESTCEDVEELVGRDVD